MSVIKKLAGETVLYGISSILGRFINFLLVPLHTYIFGKPHQLADNGELYTYVIVLNVLYTYGMETGFFRYASKEENRQEYYNLILSSIITSSVIFSGLFILFAHPLINSLGYPGKERLIVWLAIIVAIDAITAIPFARLRMEKKAKKFVKIRLTNIGLNIFFNLFYLVFCRGISEGKFLPALQPFANFFYNPNIGPDYIIWANFLANLALIWLFREEFGSFSFKFNKEQFKTVWIYAYPILIMNLAGTINMSADRLMLKHWLPEGFYEGLTSKDALGIYTQCYKLSVFMAIATQAFRFAADPFFFSKTEDKNAPPIFADVMKWYVIACVIIWVGVSLNLDFISHLLGKNYRVGVGVVSFLLLANLFVGVYWNLSVWFKLSDKTGYGTMITFIGMTLTVLLNILLIPQMGYMGCAITFVISSFVMCAICYVLGQKFFPIPYDLKTIGFYMGLAAIFILVTAQFPIQNMWLSVPFHLLLCVLFLAIIAYRERRFLGLTKYFGR